MRRNIVTAGLALALATGGVLGLASPASAAASGCSGYRIYGSDGHAGANVTCTYSSTGYFAAKAECERLDNGQRYLHYGTPAAQGRVSTVWCDRHAKVNWINGVST